MNYFKTVLLLGGLILGAFEAQGKIFKIECSVFSYLKDVGRYEIAKGTLEVDEQTVSRNEQTPEAEDYVRGLMNRYCSPVEEMTEREKQDCKARIYMPIGIRSPLFGKLKGLRLQISAWRDIGENEPLTFYQRVFLNGSLVQAVIDGDKNWIVFNDDGPFHLAFSPTGEPLPPEEAQPSITLTVPETSEVPEKEIKFHYIYSVCTKEVTPSEGESSEIEGFY